MGNAQELLYLDTDEELGADDQAWDEYIEPIIANTKTAVVTGTPRFFEALGDAEGRVE